MPNPLRRMNLWQKAAALALIGVAVTAVPLLQVVRTESAAIRTAHAEEAGLDPVRTALQLQRHLQVHRSLAAMVLGGNANADAERRARVTDIDTQLVALSRLLGRLGDARAVEEARALHSGWRQLARQVEDRSISAHDSVQAHDALVDRNIRIIDLVADASGLSLDPPGASHPLVTALFDELPRLAEVLDTLQRESSAAQATPGLPTEARHALAGRSHRLHELQGRVQARWARSPAIHPLAREALDAPAAQALQAAAAVHEAARAMSDPGRPGTGAAGLAQAATRATAAHHALIDATAGVLQGMLHDRVQAASQARGMRLAALAGLLVLATLLARALLRPFPRPTAQADANTAEVPRLSEHRRAAAQAIGALTGSLPQRGLAAGGQRSRGVDPSPGATGRLPAPVSVRAAGTALDQARPDPVSPVADPMETEP